MAQPTLVTRVMPVSGQVQVTVAFEASASGTGSSDFGPSDGYKVVVNEYDPTGAFLGSTSSAAKSIALARAKYTDMLTVSATGGNTIEAGLTLAAAVGHAVTAYNIDTRVELL